METPSHSPDPAVPWSIWQVFTPDPEQECDRFTLPRTAGRRPVPLPGSVAEHLQVGAVWSVPGGSFPSGPQWAVTAENAGRWDKHRFAPHFAPRLLKLIVQPEGHPLFELRLDLLEYASLFERFVAVSPQRVLFEPPSAFLRDCLVASCASYAEGLAAYLRPGREDWGRYVLT